MHIVVPSERIAYSVHSKLGVPADRITVIPHGVDIAWARSATRAAVEELRASLGLAGPVLLFVGNLSDRKNAITVLQAYADLPRGLREDTHLVLVGGEGCDAQRIGQMVESERLHSRVHLVGHVPP
jgi:glycosyltransferase involved in cell wall biosynthesis